MLSYKIIALLVVEVITVRCFPNLDCKSHTTPYKLYSRDDWGASPAEGLHPLTTPVPYAVIHHTYKPDACTTHEECMAAMKSMQNYHQSLGWGDIGYNFCIGDSGDVYEGRGWEMKGIHAGPANSVSVGICLIGDWRVKTPPQDMLDSTQQLLQFGVDHGFISPDYKLVGHNQVMATECPGTTLFNILSTWDHFSNKFSA